MGPTVLITFKSELDLIVRSSTVKSYEIKKNWFLFTIGGPMFEVLK